MATDTTRPLGNTTTESHLDNRDNRHRTGVLLRLGNATMEGAMSFAEVDDRLVVAVAATNRHETAR